MSDRTTLLDVSATALNQNGQHDDKENAANDADKQNTVHFDSSFLNDSWS
jgi:hypothetical protein